jgi:amidase
VLQCLAGCDGYDPRQAAVPAELPDYVGALGKGLEGLRVGVLSEGFGVAGAEADVESIVGKALATLESGGARLDKVSIPAHRTASLAIMPLFLEGGRSLYDTNFAGCFGAQFYPASFMATFGRAKRSHSHELPLNFKLMLLASSYAHDKYNGRLYAKAQNARPVIIAKYLEAFRDVDVLAMPTVPVKSHRYRTPADFAEAIESTFFGGKMGADLGVLVANSGPFNYTGFPALSLPCGKSDGMPVGLQLVAPHFREDALIRAAHAFQRAVDWQDVHA